MHPEPTPAERDRVLRVFPARDGGLATMPRAGRKRQIVLEHIVMAFEPGVRYGEDEVNAVLRVFHPDYAALRRYLIDVGLLARNDGEYWRIGGWVDV